MKTPLSPKEHAQLLELLLDITVQLISTGAHTAKAIRIAQRIAEAYEYDADMIILPKSISISLSRKELRHVRLTAVRKTAPLALNSTFNHRMSALSWRVHDEQLPLEEVQQQFLHIVALPRMNFWLVLCMVACANASFCFLFGGDMAAMGLVFCGTAIGFWLRRQLMEYHLHHYFALIGAAFVASFIAGLGTMGGFGSTPSVALATSVLFLIPGVPLLNALIDIMEGHVINGIAAFISSCTMIVCLALGLLCTLCVLGVENL
jgi:uncharacterized membrane protein YjjP (DUF1212 family)